MVDAALHNMLKLARVIRQEREPGAIGAADGDHATAGRRRHEPTRQQRESKRALRVEVAGRRRRTPQQTDVVVRDSDCRADPRVHPWSLGGVWEHHSPPDVLHRPGEARGWRRSGHDGRREGVTRCPHCRSPFLPRGSCIAKPRSEFDSGAVGVSSRHHKSPRDVWVGLDGAQVQRDPRQEVVLRVCQRMSLPRRCADSLVAPSRRRRFWLHHVAAEPEPLRIGAKLAAVAPVDAFTGRGDPE
mmetsp:Transcript_25613/g.67123  ORF Transcript_25613/g.67123 Transcript_25613/m.67123 type:complete len:243 (-) Transcript_25613:485-1213(-)